jgi:hypothetical protein
MRGRILNSHATHKQIDCSAARRRHAAYQLNLILMMNNNKKNANAGGRAK